MLRSLASNREGSDIDAADIRTARSHLNGSNAWNDGWRSNGDVEFVRSGVDCLEYILAADVGMCNAGSDHAEEQGKDEAKRRGSKLHRCTLRIQRPKLNPIHALIEA